MKHMMVLVIALCLMSCSSIEIKRITGQPNVDGLRFYRPEPYMLVTDSDKGLNTAIIWLPNLNEEYVIRPKGIFGSSEINAKIADGWNLTELGLSRDSKTPETISSLSGALGAIAGEVAKSLRGEEKTCRPLAPGLYRIVFKNGRVSGLERIELLGQD